MRVNPVGYKRIEGLDDIDVIKPLWEKLRVDHFRITFPQRVIGMTWEKRMEEFRLRQAVCTDVAYTGEQPIGYCANSYYHDGKGEVDSLFVEDSFRGQGIGKELVRRGIEWLRKKNSNQIVVLVAGGNEEALGFYNGCGFRTQFYEMKL